MLLIPNRSGTEQRNRQNNHSNKSLFENMLLKSFNGSTTFGAISLSVPPIILCYLGYQLHRKPA